MTFALFVDDTLATVFATSDAANTARDLCLSLLGGFSSARVEPSNLDAVYSDAFEWFCS